MSAATAPPLAHPRPIITNEDIAAPSRGNDDGGEVTTGGDLESRATPPISPPKIATAPTQTPLLRGETVRAKNGGVVATARAAGDGSSSSSNAEHSQGKKLPRARRKVIPKHRSRSVATNGAVGTAPPPPPPQRAEAAAAAAAVAGSPAATTGKECNEVRATADNANTSSGPAVVHARQRSRTGQGGVATTTTGTVRGVSLAVAGTSVSSGSISDLTVDATDEDGGKERSVPPDSGGSGHSFKGGGVSDDVCGSGGGSRRRTKVSSSSPSSRIFIVDSLAVHLGELARKEREWRR